MKIETAVAETVVKPLQLRGRFFTAVALRTSGEVDQTFFDALDDQLRRMPHFFENAPFVIDLEDVDGLEDGESMQQLVDALHRRKLSVFGVQNGTPRQEAAAARAGMISLSGGREAPLDRVRGAAKAESRKAQPVAEVPGPTTRLVTEPVRSGQKIFADCGDLVVVAPVSSGAELIATGNIHVYGQLRGRALAGVGGDEEARIFCQSLDAELLAVAGLYLTSEDLDAHGLRKKRIQAFLKDEKLQVETI